MPRSRHNHKSKHIRNEARRATERQAVADVTRIRLIVESFSRQSQLDTFLLQCEDPVKRRAMFEFVRPFIKFRNPECPSPLAIETKIIAP